MPNVVGLMNPTLAVGWTNLERMSLSERSPADPALVHHPAIGRNIPVDAIIQFLHDSARCVLVDWIPKDDAMAQRLLSTRTDTFRNYSRSRFEATLARVFVIERTIQLPGSDRVLYRAVRPEDA